MPKLIDLTGKRFGRLFVLERADVFCRFDTRWVCECDCGKGVTRFGRSLRNGETKSCGCHDVKALFWSKVKKTKDCWLWQASTTRFGYGIFWIKERRTMVEAHIVAWTFVCGEVPKGVCVLHKCDVPACVNPAHLYLGTKKDNAIDRRDRRRHWIDRDPKMALAHMRRISKLGARMRRRK